MAVLRTYSEYQKRTAIVLAATIPCPDCGAMLPAGDDAYDMRKEHYAQCPGKPPRPDAPRVVGLPDFTKLTDEELSATLLRVRGRLLIDQNPERMRGVQAILQPAYKQVIDAVEAELARRKGD